MNGLDKLLSTPHSRAQTARRNFIANSHKAYVTLPDSKGGVTVVLRVCNDIEDGSSMMIRGTTRRGVFSPNKWSRKRVRHEVVRTERDEETGHYTYTCRVHAQQV